MATLYRLLVADLSMSERLIVRVAMAEILQMLDGMSTLTLLATTQDKTHLEDLAAENILKKSLGKLLWKRLPRQGSKPHP